MSEEIIAQIRINFNMGLITYKDFCHQIAEVLGHKVLCTIIGLIPSWVFDTIWTVKMVAWAIIKPAITIAVIVLGTFGFWLLMYLIAG